ncbi:hypothetical protein ANT_00010 [Anaerolinea thermophila UNI-1]|uniref:Uncharacterized protein n=1 Tax=Anaerolinea thermophila (strain DSM 14523 / JCM 11388 / NBRC 100420 / UNI-1) TaxID=926569 RepID=E8MY90_ANATU|nr:hypothetical protein ANT_00010 [Anaerolinea thermophila UNI-1]
MNLKTHSLYKFSNFIHKQEGLSTVFRKLSTIFVENEENAGFYIWG